MRTFRVYKPATTNAAFLELEHAGAGFLSQIGRAPRPVPSPPDASAPSVSAPSVLRSRGDRPHVLFVHQNYPAQFGHVAEWPADRGCRCTFGDERPPAPGPVERVQHRLCGGATKHDHPDTRPFENATYHALGVYEALRARPDVRPDLIVGHSGFGSTLSLRELYPSVPIVNYFEYYYHTHSPPIRGTDLRRAVPERDHRWQGCARPRVSQHHPSVGGGFSTEVAVRQGVRLEALPPTRSGDQQRRKRLPQGTDENPPRSFVADPASQGTAGEPFL
jgi:hypothetical protein